MPVYLKVPSSSQYDPIPLYDLPFKPPAQMTLCSPTTIVRVGMSQIGGSGTGSGNRTVIGCLSPSVSKGMTSLDFMQRNCGSGASRIFMKLGLRAGGAARLWTQNSAPMQYIQLSQEAASLRMKRFQDEKDEIARMLDLNIMINEYMGKRKPIEEPKPRVSTTRPLLVFDLNLNINNLPPRRPIPQRSTETIKGRSLIPVSSNRLRSHTTLSCNDDMPANKKTGNTLPHQLSIDRPVLDKVVKRYQRVQSAKIAINKIAPRSEPLDTGLSKPHFSSLDARCSNVDSNSEKTISNRTVLKNRYDLVAVIGRGPFSMVHRAKDTLTAKDVAIKVISDPESTEPTMFRYMEHPNIVRVLNTFSLEGKLYMVMEYYPLTLSNYLKTHHTKGDEGHLKTLFRQLCRAVQHAHTQGIIHRDLKLENVLVEPPDLEKSGMQQPCVKLIDFGLAVRLGDKAPKAPAFRDFCGTPNYVAPEIIGGEEYEGKPADCWALGVILYLMLVGRFPFKAKQEAQLYRKIKRGKLCFPADISEQGRALISGLLRLQPSERLNIYGVLKHEWFQN